MNLGLALAVVSGRKRPRVKRDAKGLWHDRIHVQDVTDADALVGHMTMRLEQIPVSRSPNVGRP